MSLLSRINPFRRAAAEIAAPLTDTRFKGMTITAGYEGASLLSQDRSWLPAYVQDASQDMDPGTRWELMRKARYFEQNHALVSKILDLIEANVVGTGINGTPMSSSPEWNAAAGEWFREWSRFCDLSTRQHFGTLQGIAVRAEGVDGECFIRLTYSPDTGRPRVQLIESHRIGSATLNGRFTREGYHEFDGIVFEPTGRPAFYIVANNGAPMMGRKPTNVTLIPADEMVHIYEPARAGQPRGITLFHSVLHTLHDLDDLQKLEMLAAKDASTTSTVVTGGAGEAEGSSGGIGSSLRGQASAEDPAKIEAYIEKKIGGRTVYLKDGYKAEQFRSDRPSPAMREFWEYLVKTVCRGVGVSYAAVNDYEGGWGGAALRGAVAADNRFFDVRASVLLPGLDRIYQHAIGWAIRNGEIRDKKGNIIPAPPDFYKIEWHSPRRSTVDIGRESAAVLNELRAGLRTYRDVLGEGGQDWRDTLRQRIMEQKFIADVAKELELPAGLVLGLLGAANNTGTYGEKAAAAIEGEPPPAAPAGDSPPKA